MTTKFYQNGLVLLVATIFLNFGNVPALAANDLHVETVIAGEWGSKYGDFGIEKKGKTETGYALDLLLDKNTIYILDSINNRIQLFDLNGNFREAIKLHESWQEFGVTWNFALFKNSYFLLVGKPPYYSPLGIREIHKFSFDGRLISKFGNEYVPTDKEEYYDRIFSVADGAYLICGIGGKKILTLDSNGKLIDTLIKAQTKDEIITLQGTDMDGNPIININRSVNKELRTIVLDVASKKVKKEVKGRFSLLDKDGNFYFIRSTKVKGKLITKIEMRNPITKLNRVFKIDGNIQVKIKDRTKDFHYSGNFTESAKLDSDGNIYHLIALDDGVLLRRITINSKQ